MWRALIVLFILFGVLTPYIVAADKVDVDGPIPVPATLVFGIDWDDWDMEYCVDHGVIPSLVLYTYDGFGPYGLPNVRVEYWNETTGEWTSPLTFDKGWSLIIPVEPGQEILYIRFIDATRYSTSVNLKCGGETVWRGVLYPGAPRAIWPDVRTTIQWKTSMIPDAGKCKYTARLIGVYNNGRPVSIGESLKTTIKYNETITVTGPAIYYTNRTVLEYGRSTRPVGIYPYIYGFVPENSTIILKPVCGDTSITIYRLNGNTGILNNTILIDKHSIETKYLTVTIALVLLVSIVLAMRR